MQYLVQYMQFFFTESCTILFEILTKLFQYHMQYCVKYCTYNIMCSTVCSPYEIIWNRVFNIVRNIVYNPYKIMWNIEYNYYTILEYCAILTISIGILSAILKLYCIKNSILIEYVSPVNAMLTICIGIRPYQLPFRSRTWPYLIKTWPETANIHTVYIRAYI